MKISTKQYAWLLLEITQEKDFKSALKNFVVLVAKNHDLKRVESIIKQFELIWQEQSSVLEAKVVSRHVLNKEIRDSLNSYLIKLTGKKEIVIKEELDEALLGGFVLKFQDQVIDASLKNSLQELRRKMIS